MRSGRFLRQTTIALMCVFAVGCQAAAPSATQPQTSLAPASSVDPGLGSIAISLGSKRLTCEGDGNNIRFDSDIYLVSIDGKSKRRLTSGPGSKGWSTWSPDGRRVAYRLTPDGCNFNRSDLAVVTVDDLIVDVIVQEAWSPSWSPDGDWIAYYSASQKFGLNLVRPDGTDDHQILAGDAEYPTWSPDGTRLAFMSLGFPAGSSSADYDIYVVQADGRGLERLTTSPGEDGWPAWSPDGSRIAYVHMPTEDTSEIHVMSADGRDDTTIGDLTDELEEAAPSWSPDGAYLVYQAYGRTEPAEGGVFVIHPDGTGQQKLFGDGSEPRWMPVLSK